jgi:thiosulfate/3-mercaptopyruvate sulfurtransferase
MKLENILIEAGELLKKVNDENIRIFDATITDDMYEQGHIHGAAYFDHERFSDPASPYTCTMLPDDRLIQKVGEAGISNASEVVVYACGMLPYAIRAWWVLRYAGHDNVRILNGGLTAWKNAGGKIEQELRQYEPSVFSGHIRTGMFASKDEVFASMEDKDVAIVNVLPAVSYEGSHIPGSINLSCVDLMEGDFMQGMDYLRPIEQLAPRLAEVAKHKRIITYCGGGIAAAVNAAAHLMTGHENVAVYDGSLYEWLGEGMPITGTGKWEFWKMQ